MSLGCRRHLILEVKDNLISVKSDDQDSSSGVGSAEVAQMKAWAAWKHFCEFLSGWCSLWSFV